VDQCKHWDRGLGAGPEAHIAVVRQRLAAGPFKALVDAKAEDDLAHRDARLEELRALARYPCDPVVREAAEYPLSGGRGLRLKSSHSDQHNSLNSLANLPVR